MFRAHKGPSYQGFLAHKAQQVAFAKVHGTTALRRKKTRRPKKAPKPKVVKYKSLITVPAAYKVRRQVAAYKAVKPPRV